MRSSCDTSLGECASVHTTDAGDASEGELRSATRDEPPRAQLSEPHRAAPRIAGDDFSLVCEPASVGAAPRIAGDDARARLGVAIVEALAARIAAQFKGAVSRCDLASVGNHALARLLADYVESTAPLEPYLRVHLRWAMLAAVRRARRAARRQRPLLDEPPADSSRSPERTLARTQLVQALGRALAQLDDDTRSLLTAHYFEDRPFAELASERSLDRAAVSRWHTDTLARLERRLRRQLGDARGAGWLG